jgi:uncharacterized protein YehS (DUF1456 family)
MIINTNEILYKIQKALSLSSKEMFSIYKLENYAITESEVNALLTRHQDKSFKICSYEELGVFLDGLITFKRGVSPKKGDTKKSIALSNNLILKKLRIALEIKEPEIEIIFGLGDITLTKQQLSSLFRKETQKNFKLCSDSLLLAFLEGLEEFYYDGKEI